MLGLLPQVPVPLDGDGVPLVVGEAVAGLHGHPERRVAHLELELQLVSADDGQLDVVLRTLEVNTTSSSTSSAY